jgi:electron transfer flavoprotein alpha subunit
VAEARPVKAKPSERAPNVSPNRGVLLLAERNGKELAKTSAELVTAGLKLAGQLGEQLFAVIAGSDLQDSARDLSNLGVSSVLAVTDPLFDMYSPEPHLALLTEICRDVRPRVVLMGHTDVGRDLAPRLAFKLGVGFAPNCVGMDFAEGPGTLRVTRPVFGGKAHGLFTMGDAEPHVLTVGQRVFEPAVPRPDNGREIRAIAPAVDPATFRTAIVERVESGTEGIRL